MTAVLLSVNQDTEDFSFDNSGIDDGSQLESSLANQIAETKLDYPQSTIEELGLISNQRLTNYLDTVLQKIAIAHCDLKKDVAIPELKILLSDSNTFAGAVQSLNAILVDRRLLLTVTAEDQLIFCLAHELAHFAYRKINNISPDSKPTSAEETWCDLYARDLTVQAGYMLDAGADFFQILIEAQKQNQANNLIRFFRDLKSIIHDPHFSIQARYEYLKNTATGAERLLTGNEQLGAQIETPSSLPIWLIAEAQNPRHTSFLTSEMKKFGISYEDFETLQDSNLSKCIAFVRDNLEKITNGARFNEYLSLLFRIEDNLRAARGNNQITFTEQVAELGHSLIDQAIEVVPNLNYAYENAFELIYEISKMLCNIKCAEGEEARYQVQPIGKLRNIYNAYQKFADAKDLETALDAARQYQSIEKQFENFRLFFLGHTANYELVLPKLSTINIENPKDPILELIQQDKSGVILNLYASGNYLYKEEELFEQLPLKFLEDLPNESNDYKLTEYIKQRKQFDKFKLPTSLRDFMQDPKEWLNNYSRIMELSSWRYSDNSRHFIKLHPLYGNTWEQAENKIKDCWNVFTAGMIELNKQKNKAEVWSLLKTAPKAQCYSDQESPYIKIIAEALSNFSARTKISMTQEHLRELSLEEKYALIGIRQPTNFSQVWKLMNGNIIERLFKTFTFHEVNQRKVSDFCLETFNDLFNKNLDRPLSPKSRSLLCEEFLKIRSVFYSNSSHTRSDTERRDFHQIIEKIIFKDYKASNNPKNFVLEPLPAETACALYACLDDEKFIPDQRAASYLRDFVLEQICKCKPTKQASLALSLLEYRSESGRLPLVDFQMNKSLINIYTSAIAKKLKADDDLTLAYEHRLTNLFKPEKIALGSRRQACVELGHKLNTQRGLSNYLRKIYQPTIREIDQATIPSRGLEIIIKHIADNPELKTSLIYWLTSDGSKQANENFRSALGKFKNLRERHASYQVLSNLAMNVAARQASEYSYRQLEDYAKLKPEEQVNLQQLGIANAYAYFVSQVQEVQVLILKEALIPADKSYEKPDEIIQEASDLIINRILPIDTYAEGSTDHRNLLWLRDFLYTLIEVSHSSEKGIIIAALAAAARINDTERTKPNLGKILADILPQLGTAYIKLAQALHSSDYTPAEFKPYLANAKGHLPALPNWEIWDLIDERIPAKVIESEIGLLKNNAGTASINTVSYYLTPKGVLRALGLQKRYAAEQAKKGYNSMAGVVNKAKCVENYRQQALEIINNARALTEIETDPKVLPRQAEIQYAQYQGTSVKVNQHKFHFKPRQWLLHGDGWRTMEAATGVTFNKLPEATISQKEFKDNAAVAIVIEEFINILRGEYFDYNRHENQYPVDGNTIYPIDAGGLSIELPTSEDLNKLAAGLNKLIQKGLSSNISSGDFEEFTDGLKGSCYQGGLKDALLYLNFAIKRVKPEQWKGVFIAVFNSGEVHPIIMAEIQKNLVMNKWEKLLSKPWIFRNLGSWLGYPVFNRK